MATRRKQDGVHVPGLPSLNRARHDRKRQIVTGKARIYGGSPQFWMWSFLGLCVFIILYWKFAQGELASQKGAVMAKQRAVAQTLGPKIVPFCEQIEGWAVELANGSPDDFVADDVDMTRVQRGPGVYLRMRRRHVKDAASIRTAAAASLRDGFTSCLFVRSEPADGKRCHNSSECDPGQLCNDWRACARPSQPFNMRLAYRALRVLEPEWTDELHKASTDLKVRAFELDLQSVVERDVPIAAEVLARAKYVTVVLDDEPAGGLPPVPKPADGGAGLLRESEEERLHRVAHRATVGIWDLAREQLLVRVTGMAAGSFVPVGAQSVASPEVRAAQERQVNSCALALHLREVVAAQRAKAAGDSVAPDAGAKPTVR